MIIVILFYSFVFAFPFSLILMVIDIILQNILIQNNKDNKNLFIILNF